VLLDDQDRSLWDRGAIEEATRLTTRALRFGRPGRYVLQAAIALEHSRPTAAETRWDRIVALYSQLAALDPDPVLGARDAAADAYARAHDLAGNAAERAFLERRRSDMTRE
jgi:RNA polymerase sigma-70 factor, ECF subfamily